MPKISFCGIKENRGAEKRKNQQSNREICRIYADFAV